MGTLDVAGGNLVAQQEPDLGQLLQAIGVSPLAASVLYLLMVVLPTLFNLWKSLRPKHEYFELLRAKLELVSAGYGIVEKLKLAQLTREADQLEARLRELVKALCASGPWRPRTLPIAASSVHDREDGGMFIISFLYGLGGGAWTSFVICAIPAMLLSKIYPLIGRWWALVLFVILVLLAVLAIVGSRERLDRILSFGAILGMVSVAVATFGLM